MSDSFDDPEGEAWDRSAVSPEEHPAIIDITPELRAELLNSGSWEKILDLFARTAKVAVALIGTEGQLLGTCHNPNPIWSLARKARPVPADACLFCLETRSVCSAIANAVRTNSLTLVSDDAGFAHTALPLMLGGKHVATLLAGQILGRYPEVLPLRRLAREFGLSAQQIWNLAGLQVPMSRAHLTVFGELLLVLGQTFLRDCYGAFLEKKWAERTVHSNSELAIANSRLTKKVAELDRSMIEKEILLKEVHHRVKNNLQVVSSLLSLQMDREGDSLTSVRLRDAYERIYSMSLVHEHIYRSTTLADLDLGEYVEGLGTHLYQSYCPDRSRIRLKITTESMRLAIDQAIPCGLILNELISNALKHAFNEGKEGLLEIGLRTMANRGAELIIADNGVGLPAGFDLNSTESMGMQVVAMLTLQMEGWLEISRESGTRFVLSWTAPEPPKASGKQEDRGGVHA